MGVVAVNTCVKSNNCKRKGLNVYVNWNFEYCALHDKCICTDRHFGEKIFSFFLTWPEAVGMGAILQGNQVCAHFVRRGRSPTAEFACGFLHPGFTPPETTFVTDTSVSRADTVMHFVTVVTRARTCIVIPRCAVTFWPGFSLSTTPDLTGAGIHYDSHTHEWRWRPARSCANTSTASPLTTQPSATRPHAHTKHSTSNQPAPQSLGRPIATGPTQRGTDPCNQVTPVLPALNPEPASSRDTARPSNWPPSNPHMTPTRCTRRASSGHDPPHLCHSGPPHPLRTAPEHGTRSGQPRTNWSSGYCHRPSRPTTTPCTCCRSGRQEIGDGFRDGVAKGAGHGIARATQVVQLLLDVLAVHVGGGA